MSRNYKEAIQFKAKGKAFLDLAEEHLSRQDLAEARKKIMGYKLKENLSYFKRKNRKK